MLIDLSSITRLSKLLREMIKWFEFNYTLVVAVTRSDWLNWVQLHACRGCYEKWLTDLSSVTRLSWQLREMIDWFEFSYTLVVAVTRNDWLIWVQLHACRSCYEKWLTDLSSVTRLSWLLREIIDWFEFNYTLVVAVTRNDWLIWVQLHACRSCYEKWLTDLSSVTRL